MTGKSAAELLKNSRVEVAPETFFLLSLRHADWLKLLENPELSPRMTAPFMIFRDKFEVTLLLDEVDYAPVRHAVRETKVQGGFRLLTFDTVMDFSVVGFLAEVTRILAGAEVAVVALSAFSRDHILVSQNDLPAALKALGPHVSELC